MAPLDSGLSTRCTWPRHDAAYNPLAAAAATVGNFYCAAEKTGARRGKGGRLRGAGKLFSCSQRRHLRAFFMTCLGKLSAPGAEHTKCTSCLRRLFKLFKEISSQTCPRPSCCLPRPWTSLSLSPSHALVVVCRSV